MEKKTANIQAKYGMIFRWDECVRHGRNGSGYMVPHLICQWLCHLFVGINPMNFFQSNTLRAVSIFATYLQWTFEQGTRTPTPLLSHNNTYG